MVNLRQIHEIKQYLSRPLLWKGDIVKLQGIDGTERANEELAREAQLILGENVLSELEKWYRYTLDSQWDYVVYIVRRSYIVAHIMEEITGLKMEENSSASFLTDSSFLLCCEDFVEYYEQHGSFPSILLCDDILIHGRNLNRVIQAITERLIFLMPDVESEIVKSLLEDAIQIHLYVKADVKAPILLDEGYWFRLDYQYKMQQVEWRKMASDLSLLIFQSGYVNASYIYSEHVSGDSVKDIISSPLYYKSIYQNTVQYTKVKFCTLGNSVKAICTIRLIKDRTKDGYNVVPFVFLPNLDGNETNNLLNKICESFPDAKRNEYFIEKLKFLDKIDGKRSLNEWITLLLSLVLLKQFNRNHLIEIDSEDKERVVSKLARNYRISDYKTTKEYLEWYIDNPIFQNVDEMEQKLFLSGIYEREIIEVPEKIFDDLNSDRIRNKLDDFFYNAGKREELMAVKNVDSATLDRYTRGCCFVLKEVLSGLSYDQTKIAMAYILQMMDAGIFSLSSFAPVGMTVEGFAQFAKAGEQSLLVKVLRYIEYIPCIALIYEWCRQIETDFYDYLEQYMQSEVCDIDRKVLDGLKDLVKDLESMNQTPNDWNANFMAKYDISDNEVRWVEIGKLSQRRTQHVENYMLYNREHSSIF